MKQRNVKEVVEEYQKRFVNNEEDEFFASDLVQINEMSDGRFDAISNALALGYMVGLKKGESGSIQKHIDRLKMECENDVERHYSLSLISREEAQEHCEEYEATRRGAAFARSLKSASEGDDTIYSGDLQYLYYLSHCTYDLANLFAQLYCLGFTRGQKRAFKKQRRSGRD